MKLFYHFSCVSSRLRTQLLCQVVTYLFVSCLSVMPLAAQSKLYGLTVGGGRDGFGAVVGLDPQNPSSISAIYSFTGVAGDNPEYTDLTPHNGKLYGMTSRGGLTGDGGVIFVLDPANPSSYSILHSFEPESGFYPTGSLTIYNSTLYGMTQAGGSNDNGVIFSIDPDNASSYTVLRNFEGGASDGRYPSGSLTVYNNRLYGMTQGGGSDDDNGVIFSIDPGNPASYTVLRSFAGGTTDGKEPYGSLTVYGSKLYGMTREGGSTGVGVIFSIDPDSPVSYSVLRSFEGGASDGMSPFGSLTVYGNKLYGMTAAGGSTNRGVIFSINPATPASYSVLHNFNTSDGYGPVGSLTVDGSLLYGMTLYGGSGNKGVIFSINPAIPASYSVLKQFTGVDGATPGGSLIVYGSKLYGLTRTGGIAGGDGPGVIFSIEPANSASYTVLIRFNDSLNGAKPYGSLTAFNNKLYGMAAAGGSAGYGVIFSLDPGRPASYSVLHSFSPGNADADGAFPSGSLTVYNGKLYGMAAGGGSGAYGVIFSIEPGNPSSYTVIKHFAAGGNEGGFPFGSLTVYNDKLYGMATFGGSTGSGVIFSIEPDNPSSYTVIKHFGETSDDGSTPYGSLTVYNGKLYGMTSMGGITDKGIIFSIDPDTPSSYTILRRFLGVPTDGSSPYGSLTVYNNRLYGMTGSGGNSENINQISDGVIFSIDPTNPGSYTVLKHFGGNDGARPFGSLTVYNGKLYGKTQLGGSLNRGVIFSLDGTTQAFTKLADFTGPNGMNSLYGELTVFTPCALSASTLASSTTACVGSVVSLSATATGGSGAVGYSWQGSTSVTLGAPATTSVISATLNLSGVQVFSVTATEGGCSATATVSVTAVAIPTSPTITNSASQLTACAGVPVSLSAGCGPGMAEFSTTSTFASLTVAGSVNTPASPGSYTYHVRCTNGGCSSPAVSVTTTVYTNPAAPSLTNNGPLTCSQTSVTLTATSGLAGYSFSGGATPIAGMPHQATVTSQGVYSVVVSNSSGCTALASTTVVSTTAVPSLSINASSTQVSCLMPAVSLSAVGNGTLTWSTGESSTVVSVTAAGLYSLTLTNGSGCSAVAQVTIGGSTSAPSLTLTPSTFTLTCTNPTVSLSAIGDGTVIWSTGAVTPVLPVTAAGAYSVTLTNSSSCTATASAIISGTVLQSATVTTGGSLGCGVTTATVQVQATGATSFTLLGPSGFSAVNGTGVFSVTAGGVYTGLAGQSDGCVSSGEVTVSSGGIPPVAVSFRAGGSLGSGNCSVQLLATATGDRYVVTGPDGYVFSNVYRSAGTRELFGFMVSKPGTYTLTAYSGSCSATYTTVVTGTACP